MPSKPFRRFANGGGVLFYDAVEGRNFMLSRLGRTRGRLAVVALCALAILLTGCHKKPPPPAPPPVVQCLTLSPTNVPLFEEWIGTLDGLVNAQIRAQVSGYILKQAYQEGRQVKRGELLFEIDPRPFQAVLDQAEGKVAQDQAQLAKTDLDVKRFTPLVKEQALSQETLDNAVQANLAAKAQLQADLAAVESARLNLGFTRITSPIDGLAGVALAQVGDLVSPGGAVLTTVSTINPIRVYFQANEDSYLSFWQRLEASPQTNQTLALELILSDGSVFPHRGKFLYADRQVNLTTGTLQIYGLFPNPEFRLRPGQYALVRAQVGVKTNALVVPQRAVSEVQGGYQVTVVDSNNKAHIQHIQAGRQVGAGWIIDEGLKPGDRIVIEGMQKAKEGAVVNPQPFPSSTNSAATNSTQ